MSITLDPYNGWKAGYPTWNVALWQSNSQADEEYWRGVALELHRADPHNDRRILADTMRADFTGFGPDIPPGPYSDILSWAIELIDWDEIAATVIDDLTETEPTA